MKKVSVWPLAVLYMLLGIAYAADRLLFTDLSTGFSQGSCWLRYAAAAAALLAMAPAVCAIPRKKQYAQGGSPWALMVLAAVCLAGASAAQLYRHGFALSIHTVHALLQLGTAVYLIRLAVWRKGGHAEAPAHSALWGIGACASLYLLVPMRFMLHQSSIVRVGNTLHLLSALAALLFATVCLRQVYLPGSVSARKLCAAGLAAFLLCSCQGAASLVVPAASQTAEELLQGLALAVIGLLGLCMALRSVRQDQAQRQQ